MWPTWTIFLILMLTPVVESDLAESTNLFERKFNLPAGYLIIMRGPKLEFNSWTVDFFPRSLSNRLV